MFKSGSSTSKSPQSPRSTRGVNFYQQFPRSFIRPYGAAEEAPDMAAILRRIKPFTCEWLIRPRVALSEFAETLLKNVEIMADDSSGLLTDDSKQYLKGNLSPLLEKLKALERSHQGQTKDDDIVQTLKFLYVENDQLDEAIDKLFLLGGAMFTTACQYIVARTLIRNPGKYGEMVQAEDGSDIEFQRKKDIPSMRDFIVQNVMAQSCTNSSSARQERRNLASAFDLVSTGNTSVDGSSPSSSREAVSERPHTSSAEAWSTGNDETSRPTAIFSLSRESLVTSGNSSTANLTEENSNEAPAIVALQGEGGVRERTKKKKKGKKRKNDE